MFLLLMYYFKALGPIDINPFGISFLLDLQIYGSHLIIQTPLGLHLCAIQSDTHLGLPVENLIAESCMGTRGNKYEVSPSQYF